MQQSSRLLISQASATRWLARHSHLVIIICLMAHTASWLSEGAVVHATSYSSHMTSSGTRNPNTVIDISFYPSPESKTFRCSSLDYVSRRSI